MYTRCETRKNCLPIRQTLWHQLGLSLTDANGESNSFTSRVNRPLTYVTVTVVWNVQNPPQRSRSRKHGSTVLQLRCHFSYKQHLSITDNWQQLMVFKKTLPVTEQTTLFTNLKNSNSFQIFDWAARMLCNLCWHFCRAIANFPQVPNKITQPFTVHSSR
jgi:hypothetical protein